MAQIITALRKVNEKPLAFGERIATVSANAKGSLIEVYREVYLCACFILQAKTSLFSIWVGRQWLVARITRGCAGWRHNKSRVQVGDGRV
jgi:hypothetical protein